MTLRSVYSITSRTRSPYSGFEDPHRRQSLSPILLNLCGSHFATSSCRHYFFAMRIDRCSLHDLKNSFSVLRFSISLPFVHQVPLLSSIGGSGLNYPAAPTHFSSRLHPFQFTMTAPGARPA
jgi:hypothetical protein